MYSTRSSTQRSVATSMDLVLFAQSCLTLCDSMDRSPPGSSVHGVLQARILEWVTICFCRVERGRSRHKEMDAYFESLSRKTEGLLCAQPSFRCLVLTAFVFFLAACFVVVSPSGPRFPSQLTARKRSPLLLLTAHLLCCSRCHVQV